MRYFLLFVTFAGVVGGQTMTETAAAAAGGSVGGAAGRKVGEGISAIFNKVNDQTAKTAGTSAATKSPLLEVGPGVPKTDVPPPPPIHRASSNRRTERTQAAVVEPQQSSSPLTQLTLLIPNVPPPPDINLAELQNLKPGTQRAALLSLGTPSERITGLEDGHLEEVYHYMSGDQSLGFVRLTDGRVSSVILN